MNPIMRYENFQVHVSQVLFEKDKKNAKTKVKKTKKNNIRNY